MTNLKIHIAPKRGRLPRRYEIIEPQLSVKSKLRWISLLLLAGAGMWFGLWMWLK